MNAVGAGKLCQRRCAMEHQSRIGFARHCGKLARQHNLLVVGEIFFTQADPAAAVRERRSDNIGERTPRLATVGHQKQLRIWKSDSHPAASLVGIR